MIKGRIKSIGYALSGLWISLKEELNLRIHFAIALCVVVGGWYFRINQIEWILVLMCIGMVISIELLNTSIENLCDHLTTKQHPMIKKIKDISAAGVLVVAICAAIIGMIIFIPHLLQILS